MKHMNSTQVEALLVRHNAAIRLLKEKELDGLDALRLVIIPDEATYNASMQVAKETGPSTMAKMLAAKTFDDEPQRPRRRAARLPKRLRPKTETLDESLARL